MFNDKEEKGTLIFDTDNGLTPVVPVDKNASLGDIMAMKEMFGGKDKNISAVFIDNELKWKK